MGNGEVRAKAKAKVLEMCEWHAICQDCGWQSCCWPRDGGIDIVSQRAQLHTQLNPTHTVVVVDPASRVREVASPTT